MGWIVDNCDPSHPEIRDARTKDLIATVENGSIQDAYLMASSQWLLEACKTIAAYERSLLEVLPPSAVKRLKDAIAMAMAMAKSPTR